MSLVVFEHVTLGFGSRPIVEDLSFRIGERDRIGLVGPNGSGKSSLLRMIAGEQGVDRGAIRTCRGLRLGFLAQDIAPLAGVGLCDYVVQSVPGRATLDGEVALVESELVGAQARAEASGSEEDVDAMMGLATRLADLHERIAHFDAHFTAHEAQRILAGLGFRPEDSARDLGEFSGGWRMRAVLASLLFQRPDLLLLDEPTNHLDMPSVGWFAAFLRRYTRAFVLVCHDREFLNEQIDRVISFEPEGVRFYSGNYEAYKRQRAEEATVLENKARNLQRERDKAELFIERFRAQATKARAVQSRVKALEKMESVDTLASREVMRLRFPPCERAGDQVVAIQGLRKSYGDHVVLGGVDLTVRRGEKIGIIGVNGAGKTTLLKMIAGELAADGGTIRFGNKVKVGYFAQHHAEMLTRERTVFEEVAAVDPAAGQTRVRSLLGAFLFSGDDVDKPIGVLSGGERARVALAKLLISPGNFLLLDEPTNHLDLESSESLAEALTSYDGTMLFVSHNRAFVRRLATRIWDVHDGQVEVYPGTLDEYMEHHRRRREGEQAGSVTPTPAVAKGPADPTGRARSEKPAAASPSPSQPASAGARARENERDRRRRDAVMRAERDRRLGPLRKQVAAMEKEIGGLEDRQRERSVALADPATYADEARRHALIMEYQQGVKALEELVARWEVAQAELEEAEAAFEGE